MELFIDPWSMYPASVLDIGRVRGWAAPGTTGPDRPWSDSRPSPIVVAYEVVAAGEQAVKFYYTQKKQACLGFPMIKNRNSNGKTPFSTSVARTNGNTVWCNRKWKVKDDGYTLACRRDGRTTSTVNFKIEMSFNPRKNIVIIWTKPEVETPIWRPSNRKCLYLRLSPTKWARNEISTAQPTF